MKELTGNCRFCGQSLMIAVPDSATAEYIEEEATRNCRCREAKEYQADIEHKEHIKMAIDSAHEDTKELFHEEFPEIEQILNENMDSLVQKKFKKLTITTYGKTKAMMSFSKDTIKVEREDKNTYTRESEI